jgi:hypothetical protein
VFSFSGALTHRDLHLCGRRQRPLCIRDSFYDSPNSNTGYFLQADSGAWEGIYVHDYDSLRVTSLSRGDSITITAEVDEFFNKTQLTSVSQLINHSSNNPEPKAAIVSTGDVNQEKWEGTLVQVKNATCTQDTNFFNEWTVNDGTGPININDLMFVYDPVTNIDYHVRGPVDYAFSTFTIEPRDIFDVQEVSAVNESPEWGTVNIYPNPANNKLQLKLKRELEQSATLRLYNYQGQVVYQQNIKGASAQINTRKMPSGIYILELQQEDHIQQHKVVIQR